MEQVNNQEQVSITIKYDEISDGCAATDECTSAFDTFGFFANNGMVKIEEGDMNHYLVKKCFLSGMGPLAADTRIVALHKNSCSSLIARARLDSFKIFANAVAKKCGGNANIRPAWFGASRDEINEIVCHGFSQCGGDGARKLGPMHGFGVQLFPINSSINGVLSSESDEKGLRHILLCRVILGKMEVIPRGSKQCHPTSLEFDSGVDNLCKPSRYTVWSCYMNSHIFVDYIVSFRVVCFSASAIKTTSPWKGIQTLMAIFSRFLHPSKMALLAKYYNDLQNQKITSQQFVMNLKQVTGDKLLYTVTKFYMNELRSARNAGGSRGANCQIERERI